MKMRKSLILMTFAVMMTAITNAATVWTGVLTSGEGLLFGTEQWSQSVTLEWTVTHTDQSDWEYVYTLSVPAKDISHIVVEACGGEYFTDSNHGNSNPLLPAPITGVSYDGSGLISTWSYTTENAPVWGGFYAKSGKNKGNDVVMWTTGMTGGDGFVPVSGCDGDTPYTPFTILPEPSTTALIGLGGVMLILRRRKT